MTPVEPPSTGRTRSRWLLPVVALLVVVAAGLAAAAEQVGDTTAPAGWQPVAVLVLLVVSSGLGLEYRAAGHGDRLDLFEVAVAVALVALPGGEAVLLVALAKTATLVLQGVPPAKTAFNVAQRACAAAAGALVLALLRAPGPTALTDLAPLVPALALTYAVNTAAVLLVLAVVRAPGLRSPRTGGALSAAVANAVVNLGLGVGAAALWLRDPAAWPVLPLAMVAAHVGTRAWVHREAATARLVGLHRAAAALAGPAGLDTDVPRFLVELRGSFRCGGAQLHLGAGDERSRRWSTDTEAPAPLVAALLADPSPRRLPDPAQPELTRLFQLTRWRDLLVVPVRRGSGVAGVLLVHDRAGWEGFVSGELAVLDAVAGVLGEAVQRDHLEQVVAAAEARWRTVVRQASDVVLVLDGCDRVLDANPACAAVLGQDESALLGTDLVEVVDPEDRAGLRRVLRDVRAGRALDGRTDFTTGTGARHVEAVATRLDEPRADQLVLTARDITLRRRREQLVSELAAVLELVAGGGPLVQTLEALAAALERQVPGSRCGVVLGSGREAELLACCSLPELARPQLAAAVAAALRARPDLDQVVLRPMPDGESGSELAGAGLRMLQLRPFPPSQRAGALVLAHPGVVPAHARGAARAGRCGWR